MTFKTKKITLVIDKEMKKRSYIAIFTIFVLFSCSKEQVLQPVNPANNTETFTPSMIIIDGEDEDKKNKPSTGDKSKSGKYGNKDITDPEKDDGKGKSNKKSKN